MVRNALAAVVTGLLALPVQANGPCDTGMIVVNAPSEQLTHKTCNAATRAVAAFAECGFLLPEPVTIDVQETVPDDCLAVFHCGEARIEILTPDKMQLARRDEEGFSHVPLDRLYDSAIMHELAHALYDPVKCPYSNCLATSEYLAYSYQIQNLTDADRAPFEAAADDLGTVPRDAINVLMLALAPDRFALKSWAHLAQQGDRCTFLESVMSGTTVFDHDFR